MNMTSLILLAVTSSAFLCHCSTEEQRTETNDSAEARESAHNDDHDHAEASSVGRRHAEHEEHEEAPAADPPLAEATTVGVAPEASTPLVSAADIVSNPQRFAGQTVRIAGTVKGYCHHGRAWYAVDAPGATPPYLRVITAPAFRVPGGLINAGSMGQGTVEVIELPRARAQHFEEEHCLGTAEDEEAPAVHRPIIRATGATFTPASPVPAAAAETAP